MCRVVYIAANNPLPLIAWQPSAPAFYVAELSNADRQVARQFSKPFVYYAGSHQGCGCGFSYGLMPIQNEDDKMEDIAARESVRALSAYLSDAVQNGSIELYTCWDGDQETEPEHRAEITTADIGGETFEFKEKQLLTIIKPDCCQ